MCNEFMYFRSLNLKSVLKLPFIKSKKNPPAEASKYMGRLWHCLSEKDKMRYKELSLKANKKAADENREKPIKKTSVKKKKKKSTKKSKKRLSTKKDKNLSYKLSQKEIRQKKLSNWLNGIAPYFSEDYINLLTDAGYDSIVTFKGDIRLSSLLNLGIKHRHAEMIIEKASNLN